MVRNSQNPMRQPKVTLAHCGLFHVGTNAKHQSVVFLRSDELFGGVTTTFGTTLSTVWQKSTVFEQKSTVWPKKHRFQTKTNQKFCAFTQPLLGFRRSRLPQKLRQGLLFATHFFFEKFRPQLKELEHFSLPTINMYIFIVGSVVG